MRQHLSLDPAMPPQAAPTWPHARWIGVLDVEDFAPDDNGAVDFVARHCEGYRHARILVRRRGVPVAFVEAPIDGDTVRLRLPGGIGGVDGVGIDYLGDYPCDGPGDESAPVTLPSISVVLCTRDRPEQLSDALDSILALDYPDFEVVVVDNAASTDATAHLIERLGDPRVRRVAEPVPGLSTARNAGVRAARHDVVAFTDDDVVVDPGWLHGLARGFSRAPRVTCVSGLVPSGELRTPAQGYFDQRVSWAESLQSRVYSMAAPPVDQPLFPFQVGRFGTGANFAVRRDRILEIGGFDEALGAGTAAQGGEDLDIFFRVLTEGDTLATEPAAIVWHRHRSDNESLMKQAKGYGLGLGAWLTKVALDPSHRALAARVIRSRFRSSLQAGAHYGAMASATRFPSELDGVPSSVGRTEVAAVLAGPRALWRGRREQARRARSAGRR